MRLSPVFVVIYTNGYPVFWKWMNPPGNPEKIGQGLPASGGLIQKIGVYPGLDPGKWTP